MVGFKAALLLISVGAFCVQAQESWWSSDKNKSSEWFPECGSKNPNGFSIDQTEPDQPGPFHDLTEKELIKLREFLEKDPKIKAVKSSNATLNSSYIFTAEILIPKKQEVLNYLDRKGPQPIRQAHVIMFRGDKETPVVEECVCGPLPDVSKCELMNRTSRRNPVEFSLRPLNGLEIKAMKEVVLKKVDEKVGRILMESYGEKFTECVKEEDCLTSSSAPVGSGLVQDINKRLMWVSAMYKLPYPSLHILDFAVLVNLNETDPDKWTIEKVWYGSKLYESLDELVERYDNGSISKTKVKKPTNDDNLFSSLRRRGYPKPAEPQRPPRLVEPDGRRFSVKDKKVEYMGWSFNYRLSPLTGPAIYDVKFDGERIAYEVSLSEIVSLHSGFAPFGQTSDNVESSRMLGSRSKSLVPGAGCPETGVSLRAVFMSQYDEEPAVSDAAMCLFENNDGHALRNHLSYRTEEGGFFGGMMDSHLILRSAITIQNKDYFIDFLFHQNGVVHTKLMSTGYIHTSFLASAEEPYGGRIQENIRGNIHHDLAHFKVDLDVGGTSNRYETLDIKREKTSLTAFLNKPYVQTKIESSVKSTEKDAVHDFDLSSPKYHIVYNNDKRNKLNETKAYRILIQDMSKSLIEEGLGNDKTVPWARHQMVVTKRKDDEASSSSIYGILDSQKPAVDFSKYYEDDESILDEDLVFWITTGIHQIPHAEDIPNTPTLANDLNIFLLPHNYFDECPSMSSRDAIFIDYKDPKDPSKGVKVDRNGNSREQCVVPKPTLEEDVEENPDRILESRRKSQTDF